MTKEIIISSEEMDLTKLILKLMARGRSTSIEKKGRFLLRFEDINEIIHRIKQRVETQNECAMTDFHCEFTFADGTKDKIPSFNDFHSYRTINRELCIEAKILISFLIKFKQIDYEKQSIDILLKTVNSTDDDKFTSGSAKIDIEFTDITWANDIKNIFSDFANSHITEHKVRSKLDELLRSRTATMLMVPSMMIIVMIYVEYIFQKESFNYIIERIDSESITKIDSMDSKLNSIIRRENNISFSRKVVPVSIFVFACILIIPMLNYFIRNIPKSGIILSNEAKLKYEKENRKINWQNIFSLIGIFFSIIGVALSAYTADLFKF